MCSLCLCGASPAALDPESGKPYDLQIVLHVAPHRMLTPVFKDQLQRELRDSVQATFGPLARVELVEQHPLLKEILAKGLHAALEGWKEVSPKKTHFVLVDFEDDAYLIQAAQHDGLTGLNGPVRRIRTDDRQLVAKRAGLLVQQDFGVVGTLPADATKGPEVTVTLKGSGLGVSLEPWIKKGEVFAVARIRQLGDRFESDRLPWALLQVLDEPKGGACRCRLVHRYTNPLAAGPGVAGYRCLKLGTGRAPLRLRFLDDSTSAPLSGLRVEISAAGFGPRDPVQQEGTTGPDGQLVQRKDDNRFPHVAFVRVSMGGSQVAQLPVEIVDDRLVVCRVRIDARAEAWGELEARKKRWLGRLYETLILQADLSKELGELIRKNAHQAAHQKAIAGLKSLQGSLRNLRAELAELKTAAKQTAPERPFSVADGERSLQEIQAWEKRLQQSVASLAQVLQEKSDPKQKEALALIEEARRLEDRAEYEEAIRVYRKVLAGVPSAKVQERLAKLESLWKVRTENHGKAREFIYQTWPLLDSGKKLQENLPRAREAFVTCRAAGDPLSPEKLLLAGIAHADRLQKEFETLKSQDNEDARTKIKAIEEVAGSLEQLLKEVNEYLQKARVAEK